MVGKARTSQRKYSNLLYPAAIWNSTCFFFFRTEMLPQRQGYTFNPSAPFWKLCPKHNNLLMYLLGTLLVIQRVKSLSTVQETWVWSLGQEDPLEMEITLVFLPGEFHGQKSLSVSDHGVAKVGHGWATNTFTFKYTLNTRKATLVFTCDVGVSKFYSSESDFACASL